MLISIVLPSRNGARYLASAIESILAQSYRNFELILVDDASTDTTAELMQAYASRDSRVRFEPNPTNLKLPLSLNRGFSFARGEVFTWTSDDNIYHPRALERLLDALNAHSVDLVYADMEAMDEEGKITGIAPTDDPDKFWAGNPVGACFLYRREVHERLGGYDDSLRLAEDYDFFLRASAQFNLLHLREVLYKYRYHSATLTVTQSHRTGKMADRALERALPELKWMTPSQRMEAHFRLMILGLKRRDFRQGGRQLLAFTRAPLVALRVFLQKILRQL